MVKLVNIGFKGGLKGVLKHTLILGYFLEKFFETLGSEYGKYDISVK